MNVITIAGTVGKDAEMKYLNDGTAIASFSVADSQGKDKTVWWNASLFGKRAEALGQYILKGTKVTISGQVTEDSWTDKNGQERQSTEIPFGGIFDLEDEKHADIPLDAEIAAIVGVKRASDNPFGNPKSAAPQQQSQAVKPAQQATQPAAKTAAPAAKPQTAQPAAAAATANKWEDI